MKLSSRYGEHIGIYFAEDEDPLDWATFGAFTSRNNGSFEDLLQKVTEGSKKRIIEDTYIGYGHASIGDMVDVKLFLESIPIWLAFELEGFSRFRGQESSTRYIDFSNQKLMQYYWRYRDWYNEKIADYVDATNTVEKHLLQYLDSNGMILDEIAVHKKAIKARTFDICRGLIPSICTTNMVWYGSINEIRQHLAYLQDKKMPFVNEIVNALDARYPETKPDKAIRFRDPWASGGISSRSAPLYVLGGSLDFGSYRDLRRHRVGTHKKGTSDPKRLHHWYEDTLNAHGIGVKVTNAYKGGTVDFDHCVPLLGNPYDITYICDEDQAKYITALRTKPNVHATLRTMIQNQWGPHNADYERLQPLMDKTPDVGPFGYYLVRGKETISMKSAPSA